jgi:hypothetical protein
MPTHDENSLGSHGPKPEEIDASLGYERSDAGVTSIVVFLVSLFVFVGVCGVLTIGMGHLINAWMNRDDAAMNRAEGRTNKWTPDVNIRELGNLPNSPDMQKKVAELTQRFPTPRVQTDDGNQDVADLHRRENLLLDNYSRIDGSDGKVRIPIERAMELIAQRGLPVAPAPTQQATLMTGDSKPTVAVPLTSGFAPTAYEQDQAAEREAKERQKQ